ncbi:MAG TPA: hypothetical protein VHP37_15730 [Burkholderiales bacterium]|nr:hypothetical protein [Burkholderiales bacterium]
MKKLMIALVAGLMTVAFAGGAFAADEMKKGEAKSEKAAKKDDKGAKGDKGEAKKKDDKASGK